MHDGLIEDDLVLMGRGVMGLLLLGRGRWRRLLLRMVLLLMMLLLLVMGRWMEVVVLAPLRRHAHRRRGPPLCEQSSEACRPVRSLFALIGVIAICPTCFAGQPRRTVNSLFSDVLSIHSHSPPAFTFSCLSFEKQDASFVVYTYMYFIYGRGTVDLPSRVRIVRSARLSMEEEEQQAGGRERVGEERGGRCCGPACDCVFSTRGLPLFSRLPLRRMSLPLVPRCQRRVGFSPSPPRVESWLPSKRLFDSTSTREE